MKQTPQKNSTETRKASFLFGKTNRSRARGFTLVELMIASAIFIIIVLTGTEILITATNNYRATSQVRQSLDTLNFVMEDMTRNIRLGTSFHCGDLSSVTPQKCLSQTGDQNSPGGFELAFNDFNGNPMAYWFSLPQGGNSATDGVLYKNGPTWAPGDSSLLSFSPITPGTVSIDMNKSGFWVTDAGTGFTPLITVRIAGTVSYHGTSIPFDVQSTVAPRNLPNLQ